MIALIKHVKQGSNGDRRVIIIGHSLAGGAATIAAALEPSLIQGLVEIAPFTKAQSMGLGDFWRTGPLRLVGAVLFGSPKLWLSYLEAALPGTKRPSDWDTERERIRSKLAEPGRSTALSKMAFSPPTDAGAQLPNVKCPVLVIMGTLDCDWASPQKEGEEILAMLPSGLGQLKTIEGAGHYPHFQYPKETLALVAPFLAEVTA
jgi:pimeloyl-ACP methyl ester carboxylesterase